MPLPTEGLAVIGAGCGRTGTLSLKTALEILGLPCYHGFVVLERGHAARWHKALEDHPPEWDEIFAGFRATVDFPAAAAYKELMEHYPNAKVILSVRDPQRWAKSVMETIWLPISLERSLVLAPWYRNFRRMGTAFRSRFFRDADGGIASGAIDDAARLERAFVQWNEEVKASVPADRLLVFEASDGWAPLCEFLGLPVPDVPYPHVNDTQHLKQIILSKWRRFVVIDAAIVTAVLGVGAVLAVRALRVRRGR